MEKRPLGPSPASFSRATWAPHQATAGHPPPPILATSPLPDSCNDGGGGASLSSCLPSNVWLLELAMARCHRQLVFGVLHQIWCSLRRIWLSRFLTADLEAPVLCEARATNHRRLQPALRLCCDEAGIALVPWWWEHIEKYFLIEFPTDFIQMHSSVCTYFCCSSRPNPKCKMVFQQNPILIIINSKFLYVDGSIVSAQKH